MRLRTMKRARSSSSPVSPAPLQPHPVVSSFSCGISALKSAQGSFIMMPAPSPDTSSAEQAPRCSMQPSAVSACSNSMQCHKQRRGNQRWSGLAQQAQLVAAESCGRMQGSATAPAAAAASAGQAALPQGAHLRDDLVLVLILQAGNQTDLQGGRGSAEPQDRRLG